MKKIMVLALSAMLFGGCVNNDPDLMYHAGQIIGAAGMHSDPNLTIAGTAALALVGAQMEAANTQNAQNAQNTSSNQSGFK